MHKCLILSLLVFSSIGSAAAQVRMIFPISTSYNPPGNLSVSFNRAGVGFDVGSDLLQTALNSGRSYQCSIQSPSASEANNSFIFATSVVDPDSSSVNAVPNANSYPALTKLDGNIGFSPTQHNQTRISLVAQKSGLYSFRFGERLGRNSSSPSEVNCRETTLYGSYNRFFAQAAIVEIQNASSENIAASISIIDAGGNVVINNQGVNTTAGTRTDVIFANLPANNYGQIIITHTAPFGALSGYVAEYDSDAAGAIILRRERPLTVTPKTDASSD